MTDIGGQVIVTLVMFVITPIIVQLTSPLLYGFWVASLSVLGYLGLVDFGLSVALTRMVAGLSNSKDDLEELNHAASSAFFSFCGMSAIFLIAGLWVSPHIPMWFRIPPVHAGMVVRAFQLVILAGAVGIPLSIFEAIVAGHQRMVVANVARYAVALTGAGMSVGLLYAGYGLMALALSNFFVGIAGGAVNFFFARRYCPSLNIKPSMVTKAHVARLWSFGGHFQMGRIANTVATNTDSIIIAAMLGAAMVTPYVLTARLAVLFSISIASRAPIAVFPMLSQMFALRETEKLQRAFMMLAQYSTRLALVGGVFLAVANRQFVSLWVGPGFFGGSLLNMVFVYWVLQDTFYRGTAGMVYASGDLRHWAWASLAEAVVNIMASLLLVGPLGLVGVALGTSIGRTFTTGIYIPYWMCRKVELPVKYFLWKGIGSPVLRSLPGMGVAVACSMLLPENLGWVWILAVGSVALITNIISFEGVWLARPSDLPWSSRWRQLMVLSAH